MAGFSQTTVIGNVGKEPSFKYTPSGVAVLEFSVAVTKKWKGADGQKHEKTTWHKVVAWRSLAESLHSYIKKGNQIHVVGDESAEAYLNKDGQPAASLVLTAETITLLGNSNGAASTTGADDDSSYPSSSSDDIPF